MGHHLSEDCCHAACCRPVLAVVEGTHVVEGGELCPLYVAEQWGYRFGGGVGGSVGFYLGEVLLCLFVASCCGFYHVLVGLHEADETIGEGVVAVGAFV